MLDGNWLLQVLTDAYVTGQIGWRDGEAKQKSSNTILIDYGQVWRSATDHVSQVQLPLQRRHTIHLPLPFIPRLFHIPIGSVPNLTIDNNHSILAKVNYFWGQSSLHSIAQIAPLNNEIGIGVKTTLGAMERVIQQFRQAAQYVNTKETWGVMCSRAPCYWYTNTMTSRWLHLHSHLHFGKICSGPVFGARFTTRGGWLENDQCQPISIGGYLCNQTRVDQEILMPVLAQQFDDRAPESLCRSSSPMFDFLHTWLSKSYGTGCITLERLRWVKLPFLSDSQVWINSQKLSYRSQSRARKNFIQATFDTPIQVRMSIFQTWLTSCRWKLIPTILGHIPLKWSIETMQLIPSNWLEEEKKINLTLGGQLRWLLCCFRFQLCLQMAADGLVVLSNDSTMDWLLFGMKIFRIPTKWLFIQGHSVTCWLQLLYQQLNHLLPLVVDKIINPLDEHIDIARTDLQLACLLQSSCQDHDDAMEQSALVSAHLHQRDDALKKLIWKVTLLDQGQQDGQVSEFGVGIHW